MVSGGHHIEYAMFSGSYVKWYCCCSCRPNWSDGAADVHAGRGRGNGREQAQHEPDVQGGVGGSAGRQPLRHPRRCGGGPSTH